MRATDYRSTARDALQGKWGISLLVTLVAAILGGNVGGGAGNNFLNSGGSSAGSNSTSTLPFDLFSHGMAGTIARIMALLATFAFAYAIISFIVGGAIDLGIKQYNMRLIMNYPQQPFSTLFERFHIFGKALLLQLWMSLFIMLWCILFFIPGIVAAYRYSMAPYLMAADPNLGVREAVNLSKQMMRGNKGRLFCLHLSFIGWSILCAFTFGIGYLFLNPYMGAAEAAFYLDLAGHLQNRPQRPGEQAYAGQPPPPPYYGEQNQPPMG